MAEFFTSLHNAFKKNEEIFKYTIFAIFIPMFVIFLYKVHEHQKLSQNNIKQFSKFLADKNKLSKKEYNIFLKGKTLIKLKDHQDFEKFRCTDLLKQFLKNNLGETMIPSQKSYGLCAILSANYSELRKSICEPLFLSDAKCALFKVYRICRERTLSPILIKHQEIFFRNENVENYVYTDLYSSILFLKLYFLYLFTIEAPEIARDLNAQDFYPFPAETPTGYRYDPNTGLYYPSSVISNNPSNVHYSISFTSGSTL